MYIHVQIKLERPRTGGFYKNHANCEALKYFDQTRECSITLNDVEAIS